MLLAEDHPTNRRVVQLILEAAGVDLTCVENGAEAVEAWSRRRLRPRADGHADAGDGRPDRHPRDPRARAPAADGRAPTIYALTANAMPEHARASEAAGADGHLTKPITADALFAIVETAGRRSERGAPTPVRATAS